MPAAVASIREPRRAYYLLSAVSTLCYQLVFTVSVVYMAVEVASTLVGVGFVIQGQHLELRRPAGRWVGQRGDDQARPEEAAIPAS